MIPSIDSFSFTSLPLELAVKAAEYSGPSLLDLRLVNKGTEDHLGCQVIADLALKSLWNNFKTHAPKGPINIRAVVTKLSNDNPNARGIELFRMLASTFTDAGVAKTGTLPVSYSEFNQLQTLAIAYKTHYDQALLAIWPRILDQLPRNLLNMFHQTKPRLFTADQIRAWFNDPTITSDDLEIYELDFSNLALLVLPAEIGKFKQLRHLRINHNQLTKFPFQIGQLNQLLVLYLENNQLTKLPSQIRLLPELKGLYLENNQLTELPSQIGQLNQLEWLVLKNNQLTKLPSEIGQLNQLTWFDLRDNRLTTLPSEIGQLNNLRELHFEGNPLTSVPKELLKFKVPFHQRRYLANT